MKVKLFVLAALVFLSSINGIFFNIPIEISAQEYEKINDYNSETSGIVANEIVEDQYSNDDSSKYNTDNDDRYIEPPTNQENSDYSTYNSYEPSSYYSGNNEEEYSSYATTYNDDDDYSDNTYSGHNYYPPKQLKKFTCPNSGIVVDKEENCPLNCPAGTDLSGHLVAAGSNLQVVCDEDNAAQFEICPAGTDLEGVLVTNAPEDCNTFATCESTDPLGVSLGLTTGQTVEVADEQLCQLAVSNDVVLQQCGPTDNLPNALVTDLSLCNVATDTNICQAGTDLEGVYVNNPATDCNIFATCEFTDPLGVSLGLTAGQTVEVADEQLCNLDVPDDLTLTTCGAGTNNEGALVTDEVLCQAPNDNNICPAGTDLEGVYVVDPTTDCNIFATCNAASPLGQALGLTGTQTVEVADPQLCQLDVPDEVQLFQCTTGPMTGAIVTDTLLCQAPNDNNICPAGTDLEGVYVVDPTTDCNIFATCNAASPLGQALGLTGTQTVEVADPQLCQLDVPDEVQLFQCTTGPMTGAIVTDTLLCQAPNDNNICPAGTDLEGVYVVDPTTDCNIFATCNAASPLGQALGLTGTQTVVVADPQLCQLDVPDEVQLFQCTTGPMTGAIVTDTLLCQAPNDNNICPAGTDLEGVYVVDPTTDCNIFATCESTDPLGLALNLTAGQTVEVADEQLCNLDVPEVSICEEGSNLEGAIVTDEALCNAAAPAVQCEEGTDLEGIWVHPSETASCNLSPTDITTNFGAQCLKCADLAALEANEVISPNLAQPNPFPVPPGQNAQFQAAADLIGDNAADNNVFTICDNPVTVSSEFNSTITIPTSAGGTTQENRIEAAFELCINNVLAQQTLQTQQTLQAQESSLQEESLITNVKPENEIENEIPHLSSMSPLPKFTVPY